MTPTASDLLDLPHIVIVETDGETTMSHHVGFEGGKAPGIRAHDLAQDLIAKHPRSCVTVAVRIRQLYTPDSQHLAK